MTGLQEKRGRSIQSRLILLLLLILIPVLAIQSYSYYDSYRIRRASESQANLEIARAVSKMFESFIQDVLHQEHAIGLAITSSQSMTSKDINRILRASRDSATVRDFTWMNREGDAVYSSNPDMVGRNYSDRSYFREVANGREWMVSELIIARTTGKPTFGISRGIRDDKGALLGIVFAAINPDKLDDRLAVERGKGGGFALVDNKGMLVYRYPAIEATWEERNWLKQFPVLAKILKGEEISDSTDYARFEGKTRTAAVTPVSSIGWAVSAGRREEDVTRPIIISIAKSAFLFLFVLLAGFFISLAVSRKITNPVMALRTHALALGQGEVPEQFKISHVRELQDLAEVFNTMTEKVRVREKDLQESEQRFRVVQEMSPDGFAILHPEHDALGRVVDFTWLYENAAIARLNGTDPEAVVGRRLLELFPGNRNTRFFEAYVQTAETGEPQILEAPYQGEGIRDFTWFRVAVVPMNHDIATLVQDITERKKAEERAHHLASFPELNPNPIIEVNASGEITFFNPGSQAVLENIGMDKTNIRGFLPEDLDAILRDWDKNSLVNLSREVAIGDKVFDETVHLVPQFNVARIYGRDITERRRAEQESRESEGRFRALTETSSLAVGVSSSDGEFLYVNKAYEKLFGYTLEGVESPECLRTLA